MSRGVAIAVLLAILLNLALLVAAHVPEAKTLIGDEQYYVETARARAAGERSSHDPFWPPLYATALSGVFRLFGPGVLPAQLLQITLWLAVCAIWYRISRAVVGGRVAPLTTLGMLLFGADLAPFAHYLWPEVVHAALFGGAIALLAAAPGDSDRSRVGRAGVGDAPGAGHPAARRGDAVPRFGGPEPARSVTLSACLVAGLLLGLALLTKLLLLPLLPLIVVLAIGRTLTAHRLRCAGAIVVGVLLPVLPVVAANLQAGQPPLASSAVFNLWLGLNDPPLGHGLPEIGFHEAQRYRAAGPTIAARNDIYRDKIADKLRSDGLLSIAAAQLGKQYVRLFDRDTFFAQQLPGGARAAYRFDAPVLTAALRGYAYVSHALLLAAAAFGLAFLPTRDVGWAHAFGAFVLYNLAIFFWLHVNPRFFVQLVPFLAFFAGMGAERLAGIAGITSPGEATGAETGDQTTDETGAETGRETRGETGGETSAETGDEICDQAGDDGTVQQESPRLVLGVVLAALALYLAWQTALIG